MANVTISTLPEAASISSTDVALVVTGGITKKASAATIVNAILPAPGAIGSTTPNTGAFTTLTINANTSSNALRITQTGAGNALLVEDSASPDSTPFVITSTGKLLIGNTSGVLAGAIEVVGTTDATSREHVIRYSSDALGGGRLFNKSRSSVIGTQTTVQSGDSLGFFLFRGSDNVNFIDAAAIEAFVDGTPGTNDMPGRIVFSTTKNGSAGVTEAMRIDSQQRVGLGSVDSRCMFNIGSHSGTDTGLAYSHLGGTIPQTATNYLIGFWNEATTPAGATTFTELNSFKSQPATTGANSIVSSLYHYTSTGPAVGTGASITNQYGFYSEQLTSATNNYGFYGNIAAGTGRYNLYMAGTAGNWFSGNVLIGGAGGLGYTTGSGGAVTQITSRNTGVTLNKTNGSITLVSAAGSASYQSFTVTNSTVAATDTIIINQKSGTDIYQVFITAVAAGSFRVTFATTGGVTTEQPVFNFAVIKAVTA